MEKFMIYFGQGDENLVDQLSQKFTSDGNHEDMHCFKTSTFLKDKLSHYDSVNYIEGTTVWIVTKENEKYAVKMFWEKNKFDNCVKMQKKVYDGGVLPIGEVINKGELACKLVETWENPNTEWITVSEYGGDSSWFQVYGQAASEDIEDAEDKFEIFCKKLNSLGLDTTIICDEYDIAGYFTESNEFVYKLIKFDELTEL